MNFGKTRESGSVDHWITFRGKSAKFRKRDWEFNSFYLLHRKLDIFIYSIFSKKPIFFFLFYQLTSNEMSIIRLFILNGDSSSSLIAKFEHPDSNLSNDSTFHVKWPQLCLNDSNHFFSKMF